METETSDDVTTQMSHITVSEKLKFNERSLDPSGLDPSLCVAHSSTTLRSVDGDLPHMKGRVGRRSRVLTNTSSLWWT